MASSTRAVALLLHACAGALAGCSDQSEETKFVEAVIETYYDAQRQSKEIKRTIQNPEEVRKLASFFPRMGEGKESDEAAAEEAFGTITFTRKSGEPIRVSVSHSLDAWSEGQGDWPLSKDFEPYFLRLLQEDGDKPEKR
jgi:hypothetical protein